MVAEFGRQKGEDKKEKGKREPEAGIHNSIDSSGKSGIFQAVYSKGQTV